MANSILKRFTCGAVAAVALAAVPAAALAQNRPPGNGNATSDMDTRPYNKRDFGGLWSHNPREYGLPDCPECAEQNPIRVPGYGYFGDAPNAGGRTETAND
jgi:hypothetical protein